MTAAGLVAAASSGCGSSTAARRGAETPATDGVATGLPGTVGPPSSGSVPPVGVKKGGILRIANQADYDYYDGTSYSADVWAFEAITCNGLVDYPDTTGPSAERLRPGIAESMPTVSADGLTYTFTIRKGVRFSDGAVVTPRDVVGTYERMLDPERASAR